MPIHKPSWFSESKVMVSMAPTCGLTKKGRLLPRVDRETGLRVRVTDPETGALVDAVDDKLLEDVSALKDGRATDTLRFIEASELSLRAAVPIYYDRSYEERFEEALRDDPELRGFRSTTLAKMVEDGLVTIRGGHGSPSQEQRVGDVPYIKVSDLRAGTVNINPTNRILQSIAETQFWKGTDSGLRAFDLLSPERTSKNIGDFCVLMPGQENVVVTKEVIVLRPGPNADFDHFFLLWALTLNVVRDQWKRIIFMQTNREDVGKRYLEVSVPLAPSRSVADDISRPFRDYYLALANAREDFAEYLSASGRHHFFVSGSDQIEPDANGTEIEA